MLEHAGSSRELSKGGLGRELIFGVLFAIAGGLLGGMTGNLTAALVGAVIGVPLGALTGWALHAGAAQKAQHEASLDRTIGTEGGSIGAPGLEHPPSRVGAFSNAASGVSTSVEDEEAAGPIPRAPD